MGRAVAPLILHIQAPLLLSPVRLSSTPLQSCPTPRMAKRSNSSLPWGTVTAGDLQGTQASFSFDPLALLAVLHNLRADASAARLYHQHHSEVYRWKHTMMVGGALPPFKLLISHLASQKTSIHPTMELFKADTGRLEVKSNIGFSALPVSYSNLWLAGLLDFPPSPQSQNDILVVHLDTIHGERVLVKGEPEERHVDPRMQRFWLHTIDGVTTCLLIAGTVCSVLSGDMWAVTLFFTYLLHALASSAVSFCSMVTTRSVVGRQVQEDATIRFAIFTRPEGGKIVFKGRKDTLETWARMTWTFRRSSVNDAVHWTWMTTGSLSAAASVVCMVNMAGYLQLAYLATLAISSVCEILVTRTVRRIQGSAIRYGDSRLIAGNDKWSRAVIRSAVEVDERWALDTLPWMDFSFFPDWPAFKNLCELLPRLRTDMGWKSRDAILSEMMDGITDPRERSLAERMATEIWEVRQMRDSTKGNADLLGK